MGLINLKTDLKSLRYGNDRLFGADSGQPYIQTNIPDDISPYIGTQDYINRGGIRVVRDSIDDVKRLGKMFIDTRSPNGIFFTAKQNLLSRTAVRTQTSGILNEGIYTPLSTLAQAGVVAFGGNLNKQGINPFAQTGAYANNDRLYYNRVKKDNITPSTKDVFSTENQQLFTPDDPELFNVPSIPTVTKNTETRFSFTNRLVNFYDNQIITKTNGNPNLYSYGGGPGSFLGVGKTNIRFARDQRTGLNNALVVDDPDYFYGTKTPIFEPGDYLKSLYAVINPGHNSVTTSNRGVSGKYSRLTNILIVNGYNPDGKTVGTYNYNVYEPAIEGNTWPKNSPLIYLNNTWTYTQEDLVSTPVNNSSSPKTQDFRAVLRSKLKSQDQKIATELGATAFSLDYSRDNIDLRVNLGDPGQRANKSYASYVKGVTDSNGKSVYQPIDIPGLGTATSGLDRITSIPIYRSQNQTTNSTVNDLVKFRIDIIDNDSPNFHTFIHFRAFLDNISDSYNAQWNAFKYLGRGEDFYNYGGFNRSVSLGWTVAAQSKQELIPMYKKLNYLASSLTPDYSGNGYMRGNLARLTIGGYLYEMPGIIQGFTYDISETTWEIGVGTQFATGQQTIQGDKYVKELPHIIKVTNFQFIPIPGFLPQLQQNTYADNNNENNPTTLGFPSLYGPERYISLSNGATDNYDVPESEYLNPTTINPVYIDPATSQAEIDKIIQDIDNYKGPDWGTDSNNTWGQ